MSVKSSPNLLSVKQAAAYLSVSDSTIRRLLTAGYLPARRVGSQWRFDRGDLDRLHIDHSSTPAAKTGLPSDANVIPKWAEPRRDFWREALARMLPDPGRTQVIVIDRRGAKAFSMLRPKEFQWGVNLWHSTALKSQSDDDLKRLLNGSDVVVFDEMVQRGRDLAKVRARLEKLEINVRSICLVRRRSVFLDGRLVDLGVEPIEDLSDPEFDEAATFLSRLFDYCEPPLDPEHVIVTGKLDGALSIAELRDRLTEFGSASLIWNRQDSEDSSVAAVTLDRPLFFDLGPIELPEGIRAVWSGPCKARGYLSQASGRVTLAFITFPSLEGDNIAWRRLVNTTRGRYQTKVQAHDELDDERMDDEVTAAYLDVCTDLSINLLRQAGSAGLFEALGMKAVTGPKKSELQAFFGPKRGAEMHVQIKAALDAHQSSISLEQAQRVPLIVDRDRTLSQSVDPHTGQQIVVAALSEAKEARGDQVTRTGLSYLELIKATRPISESAVSAALDGLLDGVRAKPVVLVRHIPDGRRAERGFDVSEYPGDTDPYDARDVHRAQAIAVSAFDKWLGHMYPPDRKHEGPHDETEIRVAKLFANLKHDWGETSRLAIANHPYKHGMVPRLETKVPWVSEEPRYLVRQLTEASLLAKRHAERSDRYSIREGVDVKKLVNRAHLSGHEKSQIGSLVRAYALIQENCKVTRPRSEASIPSVFGDPLVVLASARNEKIAYECALFEVRDWIAIGRQLFRVLVGHGLDDIPDRKLAREVHGQAVAFAQAVAFLFGKLAMFEAVPQLRKDLVSLFDEHELDAGEIILETVDAAVVWQHDYSETDTPMGVLRSAYAVIRPFTSFVRQALTTFGLETDGRLPAQRVEIQQDGTEVAKDVRFYAGRFSDAVDDHALRSDIARISEDVLRARGDASREAEALQEISALFEHIIHHLKRTIRTNDEIREERGRTDQRNNDLIDVSRRYDEDERLAGRGTVVAVGDFYNFVNLATRSGAAMQTTGTMIAEALHESIVMAAMAVQGQYPTVVTYTSSDSCVLACDDADILLSATQHLNMEMRLEMATLDRGLPFMRFGITAVETDFFHAITFALKIGGDHHGFPRGGVAIDANVRDRLSQMSQERMQRWPREINQRVIYVLQDDPATDAE
jgi:excisionase family DNA binding protein